jgi:hypothetical protein
VECLSLFHACVSEKTSAKQKFEIRTILECKLCENLSMAAVSPLPGW